MKLGKRLLAFLLAFLLTFSSVGTSAFADSNDGAGDRVVVIPEESQEGPGEGEPGPGEPADPPADPAPSDTPSEVVPSEDVSADTPAEDEIQEEPAEGPAEDDVASVTTNGGETTYYKSFKDAVNGAAPLLKGGSTSVEIKLLKSTGSNGRVTIGGSTLGTGTKRITIDLNNQTLSDGITISHASGPNLYVTVKNGTISGVSTKEGGAITATTVNKPLELTFERVTFSGNHATSGRGGAIAASGTSVNKITITGCNFTGNSAATQGGALSLGCKKANGITVSGSTFSNNTAGTNGGAIAVMYASSKGAITGNTFTGNTAATAGDDLSVTASSPTITVDGTWYQDDEATRASGAIVPYTETTISVQNTFLSANFKAVDYTVTLDPNGGALPEGEESTRTVAGGSALGELPVPTREPYEFTGWYNGEDLVNEETVVYGNMELTAHWAAPADKPIAVSGEGQETDVVFASMQEAMTYIFGDISNGVGSHIQTGKNTWTVTLYGNVTGSSSFRYVGTTGHSVDLTLNLNGYTLTGNGGSVLEVQRNGGGNTENLNLTVKNGTITGGNGENGGGILIKAFNSTEFRDSGVVLTVDGVNFTGNRATGFGGAIADMSQAVTSSFSLKNDRLIVKNSSFSGNSAGKGGAIRAAKASISGSSFTGNTASEGGALYATYGVGFADLTVNDGTTFSGNSASTAGNDVVFHRTYFGLTGTDSNLKLPSGYNWFTDASGARFASGHVEDFVYPETEGDGEGFSAVQVDYYLTTGTAYTVKVDAKGGELPEGVEESWRVPAGTEITLADPTNEGKYFGGWFVDGVLAVFPYAVNSDVTLTAEWSDVPYTVEITEPAQLARKFTSVAAAYDSIMGSPNGYYYKNGLDGDGTATIRLLADLTENVEFSFIPNLSSLGTLYLTLDLNNHTLTGDGTTSVIHVQKYTSNASKINLTVKNGTVTGGAGSKGSSVNTTYGGGIYASNGVILTLIDLTVKNNTVTGSGGGVYTTDGVTLNNCTITGNTAGSSGGGVYGRDVTMNGGSVTGNTANGVDETNKLSVGGGGIYAGAMRTGSLIVNGGTVSGNTAANGGDDLALYTYNKGGFEVKLPDLPEGSTGWYKDEPGARFADGNLGTYEAIVGTDAPLTYYLKAGTVCTVTFKFNDEVTEDLVKEYLPGQTLGELPEAPEREDYVLSGWFYEDGTEATAEDLVNASATITAKWTKKLISVTNNESEEVTYYETLQDAFNAIPEQPASGTRKYTIDLLSDLAGKEAAVGSYTMKKGSLLELTINLNGHTLDAQGEGRPITIERKDGNDIQIVINGGNGTIKNGYVKGNYGGALYLKGTRMSLEVNSVNFVNNTAAGEFTSSNGGAIYYAPDSNHGSRVWTTLNNCHFEGNTAGASGGALYLRWATLNGCSFVNNKAIGFINTSGSQRGGEGGAIFTYNGAELTVNNCSFSGNSAGAAGDDLEFYKSTYDLTFSGSGTLYRDEAGARFKDGTIVPFTVEEMTEKGKYNFVISDATFYKVTLDPGEGKLPEDTADSWYVAGGAVISELPTPTTDTEGLVFDAWKIDGENVTLPYTVNSDVTFTATYREVVASVTFEDTGEITYYDTLQDAFTYVQNHATSTTRDWTIKLYKDVTENITYTNPKCMPTITIDLGGHTVTAASANSVFTFYQPNSNSGNLNLTIKNGTITGGSGKDGGAIAYYGTGTNSAYHYRKLTVEGVTFRNNTASNFGGAINFPYSNGCTTSNTHLTINNCTFENNTGKYGGAVRGCFVTINNSTFKDNTATQYGGAIYINGATNNDLTISGGSFSGNTAEVSADDILYNSAAYHDLNLCAASELGDYTDWYIDGNNDRSPLDARIRTAGYGVAYDPEAEQPSTSHYTCLALAKTDYTVTFDFGDGTKEVRGYKTGTALGALPEVPESEDYKFLGWFYANGDEATAEDVVTEDVTITAKLVLAIASTTNEDTNEILYYGTLQEAFTYVQNNAGSSGKQNWTITLYKDVTENVKINYTKTNTIWVTVDLGGHTVTSASTNASTGMVFSITQKKGTQNFTFKNGTITGGTAKWGGAISFNGGTVSSTTGYHNLTVENVKFIGNKASSNGGAIYFPYSNGSVTQNTHLTVNNCVFENNECGNIGGAIFGCYVTVNNSTFKDNKAVKGGAIFVNSGKVSELTLNGGTFSGNTASTAGDDVVFYVYNQTGTFTEGIGTHLHLPEASTLGYTEWYKDDETDPRIRLTGYGIVHDDWSAPIEKENFLVPLALAETDHTVTFDYGDGNTEVRGYKAGTALGTLPGVPEPEDYKFLGWFYADGRQATAEDLVTEDVTLTAKVVLAIASTTNEDTNEILYYGTLQEAFTYVEKNAGSSGKQHWTITLYKDVTENVKINYTKTNSIWVTVDLGGHTVTSASTNASTGMVFSITQKKGHQNFTFKNGTITGGTAKWGGAISFNGGTVSSTTGYHNLTVENVKFIGNKASSNGGAIYFPKSNGSVTSNTHLTVNNCVFENNECSNIGGAIFGCYVTVTDSTFKDNKAVKGGAIFVNSGVVSELTLSGGTFSGNTASTAGDDVVFYVYNQTGTFKEGIGTHLHLPEASTLGYTEWYKDDETDPRIRLTGYGLVHDDWSAPIEKVNFLVPLALAKTDYTVTFDFGDGSTEVRSYKSGAALGTMPEIPAKKGHVIVGWTYPDGTVADPEDPVSGDLTLTPKYTQLNINSREDLKVYDNTVVYDGKPHNVNIDGLDEDDVLQYSLGSGAPGTWVDELPELIHVKRDVASYLPGLYEIYVKITNPYYAGTFIGYGDLTILPIELTVTTGSAIKVYDGQPLTCAEATVTATNGTIPEGESVTAAGTGSQTEVGSSKNTATVTYGENTLATDYHVTEDLGTLTVTDEAFTVEHKTSKNPLESVRRGIKVDYITTVTLNGPVKQLKIYVNTLNETNLNDTLKTKVTALAKNQVKIGVSISERGTDAQGSYVIVDITGSETLTPEQTAGFNLSHTYATEKVGTLTSTATVTGGVPGGHEITRTSSRTLEVLPNVDGIEGKLVMSLEEIPEELRAEVEALADVYWPESDGVILVPEGTAKINALYKFTVHGDPTWSGQFQYNFGKLLGGEQKPTVVIGKNGTVSVYGYRTQELSSHAAELGSEAGYLASSLTPMVGATSGGKVEHVVKYGYTVTYTDGVADEEIFADQSSFLRLGAPTPAFEGGTPTREGYKFLGWNPEPTETVTGSVTYTATWSAPISGCTVTAPGNPTYSGQPQELKPTVTDPNGNVLVEGEDYELSYSEDTTNAGTVTVTITGKGEYSGEVTCTYEIQPKNLVVSTPSSSKTYDGKPLTTDGMGTALGFVEGEGGTVKCTGSQTNAGSSKNTYELTFNENTKASNYTVIESLGTLTVNPAKATVAADFKSKYYGEADPELTATVTGVVEGEKLDYTLSRVPGEDIGSYGIIVTLGENPNYDVTAQNNLFFIMMSGSNIKGSITLESWTEGEDPNLPETGIEGPGSDEYGDPVIEYSADGGETWTTEPPTEAGDYLVRATWEGNDNLPTVRSTNVFTIEHAELVKVEAKEPTCEEDGNIEYYKCPVCGKFFDAEGKELTEEDVIVPAKGHQWGDWEIVTDATDSKDGLRQRKCKVCGKIQKEVIPAKVSPSTGDESSLALWTVLMSVSALCTGAILTLKKKHGSC